MSSSKIANIAKVRIQNNNKSKHGTFKKSKIKRGSNSCEETFLSKKQPDDLFLLHFNIRSLQKHIDKLSAYLANFKHQPDIVAISETKLREGKINRNIDIYGYNSIHADSATYAGGVGLYIKNSLKYSVKKCSTLKLSNAEHLWVDVHSKLTFIVVGVTYRHPNESASSIDAVNERINEVLLSLNNSKKTFYCLGDFNINLLKISNLETVRKYANMLISCNCQFLINFPTRITASSQTLIDHIYTNDKKQSIYSRLLSDAYLSDHFGDFTIIPKRLRQRCNKCETYQVKDMTNFNLKKFLYELDCKLSHLVINNNLTVNETFDQFVATLAKTVNQFSPMRKVFRKEKKLRQKPWLTGSSLKSIQTENKMYSRLHKTTENVELTKEYKTY